MEIKLMIADAIADAMSTRQSIRYRGLVGGKLHRARSQNFVRLLARSIGTQYEDDRDIAIMSKDIEGNHLAFGMNELLYDISVFEYGTIKSAAQGKDLCFVKKGLFLVESEMADNSRAALYDFNKLILGNAQRKLFIAPAAANHLSFQKCLGAAARHCDGRLQLATIPHPREWTSDIRADVSLWEWDTERWQPS